MSNNTNEIALTQKGMSFLPGLKLTRKEAVVAAVVVFLAVTFTIMSGDHGPIGEWAKSIDRDRYVTALEPDMRRLATEGKPEAIIWVSKFIPGEPMTGELEKLAEQGSGEAMLVLAGQRFHAGDTAGFKAMMKRAAEAGNPTAVRFQMRE